LDTLNRVRLVSPFDVIVTGNEVTVDQAADKAKIWETALDHFDAQGNEAIVIEDSQQGIDAVRALGCEFSIGIGAVSLRATVHVQRLGDLDCGPSD
jgi:beta-phosphoglucomutase-like phosphatase (HAD superfamily)